MTDVDIVPYYLGATVPGMIAFLKCIFEFHHSVI